MVIRFLNRNINALVERKLVAYFKLSLRIAAMIVVVLSYIGEVSGQTTYPTSGTYTYTVPAGVNLIKVECWGAGGGGGSRSSNGAAGGGGGGAYAKSFVTVGAGNTYTVIVGNAGTAGNAGENSTFNSATVVAAGGSGVAINAGAGATGGTIAASTGDFEYAGGNGAGAGGGDSGGGGGGAGSNGSGGNASGTTGGNGALANGGNGGNGRTTNNNGRVGVNYGGGGSGARGNGNTGGTGAGGYVVITQPANIVLSSLSQIVAGNINQGSTQQPLYSFETAVSTSNATLNSISFITSGTYSAMDISRFQLWYNTTNNIATASQIGSDITTTLGTGIHTFSGLTQVTNNGTTGYFWITTNIANNATLGATISVDALTPANLLYEIATTIGSPSVGGIQTILVTPKIALSSSNPAVAAASVNQGTIELPVYNFSTTISDGNTTLNSVTFTTTGTCTGADIRKFKLWYNTTNSLASATQAGSEIIGLLGAGSHTFSGLNLNTNIGETGYFWITVDIASFPTNGRTLAVSAITASDLSYTLGIESGTAYGGGIQTIAVSNGVLLTSTHPAVSANSILQGSLKQKIYKFATIVTGAGVTINSVSFTTAGSYVATDVLNYKLWYATVNSLVGATQLGASITTGLGAGSHTFAGLSQNTAAGATGYFWITSDIASGANAANTLNVNAITTANLIYAGTPVKSGSTYVGGTQTIQLNIDSDGDGVADLYDWDDDNDGIPDVTENSPCNAAALELFPNSDFSLGNSGFSSAYTYAAPAGQTTLHPEGLYTIVADPNTIHGAFASCPTQTPSAGNRMVVNGDPTPNKAVWSSGSIAVTPHTDYTLSFYMASVTTGNPSQLIWNVNSENIGSQFNATSNNCEWVNAVALWNSGSSTNATFEIVNLNLIASGNDFALDNISCKYRINCDTDGDLIPDILDIDSDNDGIYDIIEAVGTDANADGIIDTYATDIDDDGLADAVDNQDSGSGVGEVISGTALTNPDTDTDGFPNRADIESDGDGCYDAKEAGFADADNDGKLGTSPVSITSSGKVTSAAGYAAPADANSDGTRDYSQRIPYITTQPANQNICLTVTTNASFSVTATNTGGTYQWQVSTDGGTTWTNTGTNSATLNLTGITAALDLNQYRILLTNPAFACSPLTSNTATLRAFASVPSQPGMITGISTICPSVSSGYSIAALPTALSYTWTVPAGWLVTSGAGTTTISATSSVTSGNVSVTASNTCGTGIARTLAVTVTTPTPSITAPLAGATVCQSVDVTYTTQTGNSSYVWNVTTGSLGADYTITSGGSSTDNTLTLKWITIGSKTVTVNYTSGGCSGTAASRTITVNPNTIITTQPVNPTPICAGAGISSISVTATGTPTYQWEVSTDGGSTWNNISNAAPYSNVTTATMTITNPLIGLNNYQYHCLVTGTCGAVTSNAATLAVNSSAISSQSTATQTQCIGGAFIPITVTTPGTGLFYQWYSNTTAITTGGTSLGAANGAQTNSYTPQSSISGNLYYYCIVTGTCGTITSAASGAFIVTPDNTVTLSSGVGTNNQTSCVNTALTNITFATTGATGANVTGLPSGVTGSWAANVVTISGTPLATGTYNYTVNLTGGCGANTATGSLIINPLPSTGPLYRQPNN